MKRFAMYLSAGLVIATGLALQSARADSWDRQTELTLNTPVSIEGVVLIPGKYVIQLASSDSSRTIVQIFSTNNYHLVTTLIGNATYRLKTPSKTVLTYYETSPGVPSALQNWYYPGENSGIQFTPPSNTTPAGVSVSNSQAVSATITGE